MDEVVSALAPVFLLDWFGLRLRARAASPRAEAFGAVNRFGYLVLYPAFLFTLVTSADFARDDAHPFLLGVLSGFAVMIVLGLALRLFFRGDGPAFTSVFQGSVRWNGFPLLAAAHRALRRARTRNSSRSRSARWCSWSTSPA